MRNLRSLWKATPKSSDLNFPNFPRRRLVPCADGGLIIDEEKKPKKERQDALSEEGLVINDFFHYLDTFSVFFK